MIKLGIIGCGGIVNLYKGFTSESLKNTDSRVTSLIDVNLEQAKSAAKWFDAPIVSRIVDERLRFLCKHMGLKGCWKPILNLQR